MYKFDFSSKEYEYFKTHCPFTKDELAVFDLRRQEISIVEMSLHLNTSISTISRLIKSINKKISKEL